MKLNFVSSVIIFCIVSCSFNTKNNHHLKAILVRSELPFFKENDELKIYYYKNYIVYAIQLIHSNFIEKDVNSVKVQTALPVFKTYRYFIHRANDSFGYRFENLSADIGQRLPVDSLLSKKSSLTFYKKGLYEKLKIEYTLLSISNENNNTTIEKHIRKLESALTDSIILVYKNNIARNIPFTFSKALDSLSNKKLQKLVIKNYPKRQLSESSENKHLIMSYEIEEIAGENDIIEFIQKVKTNYFN